MKNKINNNIKFDYDMLAEIVGSYFNQLYTEKVEYKKPMLCLKEKCEYCVDHEFRMSYYTCLLSLEPLSFKKTLDVRCHVDKRIEETEIQLTKLIAIKERLLK